MVGREDVVSEPWFATGGGRAQHADELDGAVGGWIAVRDATDVMAAFEKAQAAVSPVYDASGILADPQFAALGTIQTVDDPDFGALKMQNVLFRLSDTPGRIRWTARAHGADTDAVLAGIGRTPEQITKLRAAGAV